MTGINTFSSEVLSIIDKANKLGFYDKVSLPSYHKPSGRRVVNIFKNGIQSTINYARLMMIVKTQRILEMEEEVDHIDGNKLNDSYDNLQILNVKEHARKSILAIKPKRNIRPMIFIDFICAYCNKKSFLTKYRYKQQIKRTNGKVCCSIRCGKRIKFQ